MAVWVLTTKSGSAALKILLTATSGQALEELDHGVALIFGGVEHVVFDAYPALGGNRQGGIIDKGDLGFGHGLGPEYIARLHLIIHLNRDGRELPASQDVDPTIHLRQASHHVRLGAGSRPHLECHDHEYHPKECTPSHKFGLLWSDGSAASPKRGDHERLPME